MAEPFKNMFNLQFAAELGQDIKKVYNKFDSEKFISLIFDDNFENYELKERMRHITLQLDKVLSDDYHRNIDILKEATEGRSGFPYMVLPDYVEVFGLEHFEKSIEALRDFTSLCSSEFAVRPFIIKYEEKIMKHIYKWTQSPNEHIRRLASEGTRPILPWAMDIPKFRKDPKGIIPILEALKDDKSAYVRKSVANNLNSISKDNGKVTLELAGEWYGENTQRDSLVKHGLRTLLKEGNKEALAIIGYRNPKDVKIKNFEMEKEAFLGKELEFSFIIESAKPLGKLRIEYIMDFVRLKGKRSKKVFKVSEGDFSANQKTVIKKHSFRPVTTRKYYEGLHKVTIVINGVQFETKEFQLKQGGQ